MSMYIVFILPSILFCFGIGIAASTSTLFLGSASLATVTFLNAEEAILFAVGILAFSAITASLTKMREDIDWKEVLALGPAFGVSLGLTFYFSFKYYFRNPGLFLTISALTALVLLPFCLSAQSRKQLSIVISLIHGSLFGVIIGGLGFAGLLLLIPFLQVFRRIGQRAAISTCLPLTTIASFAFLIVLYTPKVAFPKLFTDASWGPLAYFSIGAPILAGIPIGIKFGRRLVNQCSHILITMCQVLFLIVMALFGWIEARDVLPCMRQDLTSCLNCFDSATPKQDWSHILTDELQNLKSRGMTAVINSCGEPLAINSFSTKPLLTLTLPNSGLAAAIDPKTGLYSDTWWDVRLVRFRKERIFFNDANCSGKAGISRAKIETQIGKSAVFNSGMYRQITDSRSSFSFASYQDPEGQCVKQEGILNESKNTGVYSLSHPTGRPELKGQVDTNGEFQDGDCCFKLRVDGHVTSTLYYSDDGCKSADMVSDDDGPVGAERSIIYHQGRFYRVKDKVPEFEYRSFRTSGKDCTKQHGFFSRKTELDAYAVEELPTQPDFSKKIPLSFRGMRPYDLTFW